MLPQRHRLRDRSVFQQLYKKGHRSRGRWLTVLYDPRAANAKGVCTDNVTDNVERVDRPTRWAIVVSKKVSRRAVDRNRIRRRIRSALRQFESQWRSGWNVIAIVKPTSQERDRPYLLDCPFAELQQEIETLVMRVGLLDVGKVKERSQKY
ncbi:MAG: ribonuclease P protein component [Cyanobacteria bacterium J06648_11]